MTDQLIGLTKLDARGSFGKEDLFNWIVDLEQQEFDDLCNQIISLYKFQQTYEGALVSDEEDLLRPWLPVLPRIVFSVDPLGNNFQKKFFYHFLTSVDPSELVGICEEILSLYSHARENDNTYIITQVFPAVAGVVESWRVHYKKRTLYSDLPTRIINWQEMLLFR
jgi:hypothetical protein